MREDEPNPAADAALAPTTPAAGLLDQTVSGARGGPDSPTDELSAGTLVGRYQIVGPLGAGGMGVVYEAVDRGLDRRVALKLVRSRWLDSADARERLRREAQAMARLKHPNVVTVYDIGSHGDQAFVAMDLLAGGTLRGWLADPRPWQAIVDHFTAAGRGLAAAHAAGIIHRDFKPDNVLLGADGEVRVADFGLARAETDQATARLEAIAEADGGDEPLTRSGAVVGTLAYMAPEQLLGKGVDARSDQFSFCVALYEALEGERPFAPAAGVAAAGGLAIAITAGRIRPWSARRGPPAGVRRAIERGLAADPAARWPGMDALLAEVAPRRRRWLQLGIATGALAGLTLAAVVVWGDGRTDAAPPAPAAAAAAPSEPLLPAPLALSVLVRDPPGVVTLSEDGSTLVYIAAGKLWTQPRGSSTRTTIPLPEGFVPVSARLTPDGSTILVSGARVDATQWEIWAIGRDASSARRVFQPPLGGYVVEASPDGTWMAVSGHRETQASVGLTLVELKTGRARVIALPDNGRCKAATWSPDGRRLMCPYEVGNRKEGLLVDVGSGAVTRLGGEWGYSAVWRDNGSLLLAMDVRGPGPGYHPELVALGLRDGVIATRTRLNTLPQYSTVSDMQRIGDRVLIQSTQTSRRLHLLAVTGEQKPIPVETGSVSDQFVAGWRDDSTIIMAADTGGTADVVEVTRSGQVTPLVATAASEYAELVLEGDVWFMHGEGDGCVLRRTSGRSVRDATCGWLECAGDQRPPCLFHARKDPERDKRVYYSWDAESGARGPTVLTVPWPERVSDDALSHDGTHLAVGDNGRVTVHDVRTGRQESWGESPDRNYQFVAWGSHGELFATALGGTRGYQILRVERGSRGKVLAELDAWPAYLRLSPAGRELAFVISRWAMEYSVAPL